MSQRRPVLPLVVVRLVGLWILAGGLAKLLVATPADLPTPVRDHLGGALGLVLAYQLVIAVELLVAVLALLRPGVGWLPAAALLLVFTGVLAAQVAAGETSCGCFGGSVTVAPGLMLAIDAGLVVLLLTSRPWRIAAGGAVPVAAVVVLSLAAVVAPFLFDRSTGPRPDYVDLFADDWAGRTIEETALGPWIDMEGLPRTALWVLWRPSCEVCADHLEALAQPHGERPLVLVQLVETGYDPADRAVGILPEGPHVHALDLEPLELWALDPPPPVELVVVDGRIEEVRTPGHDG